DAHDSSRSWGDEDPPLHALLSSAAAAAGAGRCPPDAHDSSRSWGDEDPALGVRLPSAVAAAAAGHARPPAPGSAEQCAEVAHDGSRRLGEEEWDENPPLDSRFPSAVAAAAAGYTRLPLPVEGPAESSLAAELSAAEAAPPPPRLDDVPLRGGATAGPAALALESDEELPEQELQVCEYCSRRFKPASLEKHRAVCASVFGSRGFRRGPLESQPKRLGKLRVGIAPAGAPQDGSAPLELSSGQASTAASSGGAPSRSRGCNRTGSLSRTGAERARQLCPHCGRSFHSAAFEKHTGVCQRIFVGKASPKPRAGHEARQASSEQRPRPPPPPAKSSTAVSVGLQGRASSVTSLVRQPAPKQPETAASMSRASGGDGKAGPARRSAFEELEVRGVTLEQMRDLIRKATAPAQHRIEQLGTIMTNNMTLIRATGARFTETMGTLQRQVNDMKEALEAQGTRVLPLKLKTIAEIDRDDDMEASGADRPAVAPAPSATATLAADMDAMMTKIETALAALPVRAPLPPVPDPRAQFLASRSGGSTRAGSVVSEEPRNRAKIWIRGFPRQMAQESFKWHVSIIKTNMTSEYSSRCKVQARSCDQCYNIQFVDEDHALRFHAGPGEVVNLRAGWDHLLPVRLRSFALGQRWQLVLEELKAEELSRASMRLGPHPCTGFLHLTDSTREEVWDLGEIVEKARLPPFHLVPQPDLLTVGLGRVLVDSVVEREMALVAKRR
ncbi:unnamed protein product, partial [Prorocentrum cordatum]